MSTPLQWWATHGASDAYFCNCLLQWYSTHGASDAYFCNCLLQWYSTTHGASDAYFCNCLLQWWSTQGVPDAYFCNCLLQWYSTHGASDAYFGKYLLCFTIANHIQIPTHTSKRRNKQELLFYSVSHIMMCRKTTYRLFIILIPCW
jgi:hypothetical protein